MFFSVRLKTLVLMLFDFYIVLWWQATEDFLVLHASVPTFCVGFVLSSISFPSLEEEGACPLCWPCASVFTFVVSRFTSLRLGAGGGRRSLILAPTRDIFIVFFHSLLIPYGVCLCWQNDKRRFSFSPQ